MNNIILNKLTSLASAMMALAMMGTGCGDLLKQPYPVKTYFAIEPDPSIPTAIKSSGQNSLSTSRPDTTTESAGVATMAVHGVRVSAPFDGLEFVYKDGPSQYRRDYYVNWIATPPQLLTGALTEWLSRAGIRVVPGGASVRSELVMDSEVDRLVIDRTDRSHLIAIISAHFFVTRQTNSAASVVLDKSYLAEVPVSNDSPAGFAASWGKAFGQILEKLTVDIDEVKTNAK